MDSDVASSSSSVSDAESTWSDLDEPSASQPANGTANARPTHGEKLAFQPKAGYVPAAFSSDVLTTFTHDAFARGSRKELWCVKIPDGITPTDLDGVQIAVPDKARPDARLAHILIERNAKAEGLRSFKQPFSFRLRRSTVRDSSGKDDEDARTQLIEMADGNKVLDAEANESGGDENVEMEVLHAMLPDPSRRGGYKFAPVPISQYAQLLLDAPVKTDMTGDKASRKRTAHELSADGQAANASAGSSAPIVGQREQPWDKLKGFFHPAGARSDDGDDDDDKKVSVAAPSPSKKSKKNVSGGDSMAADVSSTPKDKKKKASKKKSS